MVKQYIHFRLKILIFQVISYKLKEITEETIEKNIL